MSIGRFFNWFKNLFNKKISLDALQVYDEKSVVKNIIPEENSKFNKFYLADKLNPQFLIQKPVPTSTVLPFNVSGDKGGGYPLGTIQQQAMGVKQMINATLFYIQKKSPKKLTNWALKRPLNVYPRAGVDLNAYYDRNSLKFFYFGDPVRKVNVYTCDSHSVVTHELGHAMLDILRPDWWNVANLEYWSFHEAFGDITALFAMMQYDQLIEAAISQTSADLNKSNILTRLAPELGLALYNITKGKNGELQYAMRDMSVNFVYKNPNSLPNEGRDDEIIAECHSFARIFSNAIYDIICLSAIKIQQNSKASLLNSLKEARDLVADVFLKAVCSCPNAPKLFEAMAKQMVSIDYAQGGQLNTILNKIFTERAIIAPQIKMLSQINFDDFIQQSNHNIEIQVVGDNKIVITNATKTIKITDQVILSALSANELYQVSVTVPNQTIHTFNKQNQLVEIQSIDEDELVLSTMNALNYLDKENLVGNHNTALFKIENNELVRKQFVCKCNKPNYCDPNAPEYGKPWKPANNSGCVACYNKNCLPERCDCEQTEEQPKPKIGCYTSVKSGSRNTYKVGYKSSRRVC